MGGVTAKKLLIRLGRLGVARGRPDWNDLTGPGAGSRELPRPGRSVRRL